MKKVRQHPIVFCILLSASVAFSVETSPSPPLNLTWLEFDFPHEQLTETMFNDHVDKMLDLENEHAAVIYYNETIRMLSNAWPVCAAIKDIIHKKRKEFDAALEESEKEDRCKSRRIFEQWVLTSLELANGYTDSTRHGQTVAMRSWANIINTKGIFDKLRTVKAEIHKCFEESLCCRRFFSNRCKKQLAVKIQDAGGPVRIYAESLKELKEIYNDVGEGKVYLNAERASPPKLVKFYKIADAIVLIAMHGANVRFRDTPSFSNETTSSAEDFSPYLFPCSFDFPRKPDLP